MDKFKPSLRFWEIVLKWLKCFIKRWQLSIKSTVLTHCYLNSFNKGSTIHPGKNSVVASIACDWEAVSWKSDTKTLAIFNGRNGQQILRKICYKYRFSLTPVFPYWSRWPGVQIWQLRGILTNLGCLKFKKFDVYCPKFSCLCILQIRTGGHKTHLKRFLRSFVRYCNWNFVLIYTYYY